MRTDLVGIISGIIVYVIALLVLNLFLPTWLSNTIALIGAVVTFTTIIIKTEEA
jgi:hypothetical protein